MQKSKLGKSQETTNPAVSTCTIPFVPGLEVTAMHDIKYGSFASLDPNASKLDEEIRSLARRRNERQEVVEAAIRAAQESTTANTQDDATKLSKVDGNPKRAANGRQQRKTAIETTVNTVRNVTQCLKETLKLDFDFLPGNGKHDTSATKAIAASVSPARLDHMIALMQDAIGALDAATTHDAENSDTEASDSESLSDFDELVDTDEESSDI